MDQYLAAFGVRRTSATPSECWTWHGHTNRDGYGMYKTGNVSNGAHRMAYQLAKGAIRPGMQIDHLCRNPKCVNPNHLEEVTQLENIRHGNVGKLQLARTHCPRGHEYTPENIKWGQRGRGCKTCARKVSLKCYHDRKRRNG